MVSLTHHVSFYKCQTDQTPKKIYGLISILSFLRWASQLGGSEFSDTGFFSQAISNRGHRPDFKLQSLQISQHPGGRPAQPCNCARVE